MKTRTFKTPVALLIRFRAVRARHKALNEKIASEHATLRPDSLLLQQLKRRRLQMKDELRRCEERLRSLVGQPG